MTNLALFLLLRPLGTPCVLWTVQPEGRRPAPAAVQATRTLRGARPGAIVDLHDADGVPGAGARLVGALPAIVDGLRARGYALAPVGDLL
jgi:peptidoglycan/xylan/chitin deacetylase (PgdA/CDA1 family)